MYRIQLLYFSLFVLSTGVKAQDTLSLSFQEAVKIGLENNISLKQQRNILEINNADWNQKRAKYIPTVNAFTTFSRNDGRQFDQTTGQVYSTSADRGSLGISANYVIFDGLNRLNSVRTSKYSLLAQNNMVKRTEQHIIFIIGQQYLQALLDKELLRIVEKNFEVQETTLNQIKGFVEAGTRPLSHQFDQEAIARQIETQVIRAENQLRLDKAILMQTLLLDPGLVLEPIDPDWGIDGIISFNPDMDDLYKSALASRPDLRQLTATQQAADAAVKVAKSSHYPSLEAFASYGSGYTSLMSQVNPETGELEQIPYPEQITDYNPSSRIGLQLTIPIYNQNQITANKVRAKMELENNKLNLRDLELQIFREVQVAYLDFSAAKTEYYAAQSQFKAGQKAYDIQKERYDVGVGNLVELAQSTNTYVRAAASRAQAEYFLLFQKYILDYYTGTLTDSNL